MIAAASRSQAAFRHAEAISDRLLRSKQRASRGLTGHAGVVLLFVAMAKLTGRERYVAGMHARLQAAVREGGAIRAGLFDGVAGLRAAAALAAEIEPWYCGIVAQCDAFTGAHLAAAAEGTAECFGTFDIVSGWSGIRLARCVTSGPHAGDRSTELLESLLAGEAAWRCRHPARGGEPENDLGMAHGIAGVLAALALTTERDDLPRADLARAAWRLASCAVDDRERGVRAWRTSVQSDAPAPFLAAWCYGAPGVLAALYSVGKRIGDDTLQARGLVDLRAVAALAPAQAGVSGLGLCHGVLGNALVFASIGESGDCARLRAAAASYVDVGLAMLNATDPLALDESVAAEIALALLTLCCEADTRWLSLRGLP